MTRLGRTHHLKTTARRMLAGAGVVCLLAAPARAYDGDAYELLRFFERVCVSEAPDFIDVAPKLESIGFDIVETARGDYEARSRGSAYTVYVTPAFETGDYASCALSVDRSSGWAVSDVLEEYVYERFSARVEAEGDGAGGVRFRILGDGPSMVFASAGDRGGAALALQILPAD